MYFDSRLFQFLVIWYTSKISRLNLLDSIFLRQYQIIFQYTNQFFFYIYIQIYNVGYYLIETQAISLHVFTELKSYMFMYILSNYVPLACQQKFCMVLCSLIFIIKIYFFFLYHYFSIDCTGKLGNMRKMHTG